MPLRAVLAFVLLAACVPVPGPARPTPPPEEARGAFGAEAGEKAILLDLTARGVPGAVAERVGSLVRVALEGAGVHIRQETDLEAFWDARSRTRLLGRGTDADLARVARRFGADEVLAGWVARSGKAWVFDLRMVDTHGRVVNRAAAVWRGQLTDFYVGVRQAAEATHPAPPGPGPVDAGRIRWALRKERGYFESCLARGVVADPTLSGSATVDLTVGPTGRVTGAVLRDDTLLNQAVGDCLRAEAASLRLPAGLKAPVTVSQTVHLPAEPPKPGGAGLPTE